MVPHPCVRHPCATLHRIVGTSSSTSQLQHLHPLSLAPCEQHGSHVIPRRHRRTRAITAAGDALSVRRMRTFLLLEKQVAYQHRFGIIIIIIRVVVVVVVIISDTEE
jgi:hypothetical protein